MMSALLKNSFVAERHSSLFSLACVLQYQATPAMNEPVAAAPSPYNVILSKRTMFCAQLTLGTALLVTCNIQEMQEEVCITPPPLVPPQTGCATHSCPAWHSSGAALSEVHAGNEFVMMHATGKYATGNKAETSRSVVQRRRLLIEGMIQRKVQP